MGVNLHLAASNPSTVTPTAANNTNNDGCGAHKRKFAISDLPFAHWDIDSRKWQVSFVPLLLAWARTQHNLFGTNGQMADEVTALWEHVYPAIVLNDMRLSVILSVVRTFPEPS
jgi:hypothetical protein